MNKEAMPSDSPEENERALEEIKTSELLPAVNEKLKKIAGFFDDPATAMMILKSHLRRTAVEFYLSDDETAYHNIDSFLKAHEAAYERRKATGTPHPVEILKRELRGVTTGRSTSRPPGRERPLDLDRIENVRDRKNAGGYYGKHRGDDERGDHMKTDRD